MIKINEINYSEVEAITTHSFDLSDGKFFKYTAEHNGISQPIHVVYVPNSNPLDPTKYVIWTKNASTLWGTTCDKFTKDERAEAAMVVLEHMRRITDDSHTLSPALLRIHQLAEAFRKAVQAIDSKKAYFSGTNTWFDEVTLPIYNKDNTHILDITVGMGAGEHVGKMVATIKAMPTNPIIDDIILGLTHVMEVNFNGIAGHASVMQNITLLLPHELDYTEKLILEIMLGKCIVNPTLDEVVGYTFNHS